MMKKAIKKMSNIIIFLFFISFPNMIFRSLITITVNSELIVGILLRLYNNLRFVFVESLIVFLLNIYGFLILKAKTKYWKWISYLYLLAQGLFSMADILVEKLYYIDFSYGDISISYIVAGSIFIDSNYYNISLLIISLLNVISAIVISCFFFKDKHDNSLVNDCSNNDI